jgi:hypothetical protein
MRDIKTGLDSVSAVPSSREIEEAERRLRSLQETVAPRVRELREMDEWRRFANAQRQEQLIAMAEAIVASLKVDVEAGRESDLAATAKALRELHAQWHDVAEAPRQNAQRLWDRFRTATDFIRTRCEVHFAKLRAEREAATARRAEIVAEAEAIATSTDWTRAAVRFQELQTAWKELGPVNHEAGRTLMQQFRTAGNTFFARRREDLADRRKEWSENLAAKEALCERAEVLTESTEWEAAAAEMKRLQVAWKAIGPVRRNKSEAIWGRFRGAADRFFERFHHRHEIMLSAKLAEREAMVVELEELAGADAPVAEGFAERVRTLRTTWTRSVQIPVPGMKVLTDRWQQALTRAVEQHPAAFAGTDLDPAAVVDRMEKVVRRVEALLDRVPAPSAGLSQAEQLAAKLRSALASNAMGGRASEDAKWRAAADTVRDAQSTWQRLAPTTAPEARGLEQRFREACRRVLDEARRHGHGQAPAHGTHGDRKPQPRNDHRPRASRMPAPKPHPEPVGAR